MFQVVHGRVHRKFPNFTSDPFSKLNNKHCSSTSNTHNCPQLYLPYQMVGHKLSLVLYRVVFLQSGTGVEIGENHTSSFLAHRTLIVTQCAMQYDYPHQKVHVAKFVCYILLGTLANNHIFWCNYHNSCVVSILFGLLRN